MLKILEGLFVPYESSQCVFPNLIYLGNLNRIFGIPLSFLPVSSFFTKHTSHSQSLIYNKIDLMLASAEFKVNQCQIQQESPEFLPDGT
jgi:hypothetical protein